MTVRLVPDATLLITATALTRFACRSHYLYDIDSVNFALALRRFDPSVHQPHPPGYFLYVCLGRLANLAFPDANTALVALSIVFSCGAAAMIYALANAWFGRTAARFAGLIFLVSPLAWFHGTVALTYIVEGFFSALTGYLCWRVYSGETRLATPCAVVVGVAAGFRTSSILLLCPLLLFSLRRASRRQAVIGTGALAITIFAWFVPELQMSGGVRAYFSALFFLWLNVPSKATVFNSSPLTSVARAVTIAGIYFLCFGSAALLPFLKGGKKPPVDHRKSLFTCVWMAPGLLLFTFVYLKLVNSGYLLALAPPVCVWMGLRAATWYERPQPDRFLKIATIGVCLAINIALFIRAPVYFSYSEIRKSENELETIVRTLPQVVSPADSIIVGFDSHFLGYRHAGYYLPDYLTLQFPAVRLASGMRVFAMHDRETWLEDSIPAVSAHTFVLFPLPAGDREYGDYLAKIRRRFPAGDLRTVFRSGHEFVIGPISDLRFLFPPTGPDHGPLHAQNGMRGERNAELNGEIVGNTSLSGRR